MKLFNILAYALAFVAIFCSGGHSISADPFVSLLQTTGPYLVFGACLELTAFRTATENLGDRITRSPRLGRSMYWRNLVPKGSFAKNKGVTSSTFNIKSTEPQDNSALYTQYTLASGQPSPGCDTNYEDVGVGFYERTYGPKIRRFRGPIICREQLVFQHNPGQFISGYIDEMGMFMARVWELSLRSDIMGFGDWFVDHTKIVGPNAIATAPRPYEGLSLDMLEEVAQDLYNTGANVPDGSGYVMDGAAGAIFPLYIDMKDSANLLRANSTVREDARFASEGKDGDGNFSLWRALGANRVIGNFRHVQTNIAPRFNFTGGILVPVTPFKDITAVGTDQVILTDAYINAPFAAAIVGLPSTMTAEVVAPQNAGLNFDVNGYNGDWNFITGGERICTPPEYDPEHHKGRHFASLVYAPRPDRIHDSKIIVYKRCPQNRSSIFCS